MDITLVALDTLEIENLVEDDKFFDNYCIEDNGYLGVEGFVLFDDFVLEKLLTCIFKKREPLLEIYKTDKLTIIDISKLKSSCLDFNELESNYQTWIAISGRENTMDEYGMLMGIITYTLRNFHKELLLLRVQKN